MAARWRRRTGGRVEFAPSQEAGARFPSISAEQFARSVVLVEPDGRIFVGAEAALRALAHGGRHRWTLWAYQRSAGFRGVAEAAYRAVASHRQAVSRLDRWLHGGLVEPPTYLRSRALFVRAMAVIHLIAFVSLGLQVKGLIGSGGILPVQGLLQTADERLGGERFWILPTLSWLNSSDGFLLLLCWGGAALAVLVALRVLQGPLLLVLWVFYLSLAVDGRDFMNFQWDALLLEAGLLAALFAPCRLLARPARVAPPSPVFLWLLRGLLFRLMFLSGWVKLTSGDPTWRALTALQYHHETQPLPPWTAYFVHHLPAGFHRLCAGAMFAVELAVPFLIFAPRRLRHAGAALTAVLQLGILATGNYGFFNWLTLALCIPLLDDAALARLLPWGRSAAARAAVGPPRFRRALLAGPAAVLLALALLQTWGSVAGYRALPEAGRTLLRWAAPFRSVNTYGLFRVMTTSRPEIILEGSRDGVVWKAYEFRWKPGDLRRRPRFVAPHMPRLDWQMWFAALATYQRTPWFHNLQVRLLQGSPPVLALLAGNPFPGDPPRHLRAVRYDYRFSGRDALAAEGAWWRRMELGPYAPPLSRRSP